MRRSLSLVVYSSAPTVHEAVVASDHALTLGRVDRIGELAAEIQRLRPRAVVLDLSVEPDAVLAVYEALAERPVLVACGPDDSRLIRLALRLGARDYLTLDADLREQLHRTLGAIVEERAGKPGEESGGTILAVMGTKGGTGATFVACQLAAGLARSGAQTALVDLHTRTGDAALYLDLKPQYTLASIGVSDRVDVAYLRTALAAHTSGLQLLAAPERPEDGDVVSSGCVEKTLGLLKHQFDFVVLDLPRDFDDRSVSALDLADHILLVTTPEVPALNRGNLQLDLLRRLGHPDERIHVVVNRVATESSPSLQEIETFLSRPIEAQLANDYPHAASCCNGGRTIWDVAPRSALCTGLAGLVRNVRSWSGLAAEGADGAPRSRLRAFFSRKRHGSA